ncbi:hypothetical protein [Mangrovimonas sp. ST2L15]|uniref:hypothetical protein n=1 Tax=Mangrovimonas sp. ST2L15 TaxID=1645916 RepID=UPI000B1598D8|nr:hypothetical protein [Mangrovimonas sp. ST2L15]
MIKGDKLLLRGAGVYIIIGLLLAWSLIGVYSGVGFVKSIFPGDTERILQAHIDYLLMSALLLGIASVRIPILWHIKWAMVIGALTNSGIFVVFAMAPYLDPGSEAFVPDSIGDKILHYGARASFVITTYGFGGAGISVINSTFFKKGKS